MPTTRPSQLGALAASALAAIALAQACATGAPASARTLSAAPATAPTPRRGGDVLTAEEIARAALGGGTAFEALARLRPEVVRHARPVAAGTAAGGPVLYVDGIRQGPVGLLADIQARVIGELRYYRPGEALSWFGPGHEAGVIAVRLVKSPR